MEKLETLTYEVTGAVARITLDRPERGNGITLEMPRELAACVDPLSIALYTVKRSRLQAGDDLLVMGTGPQGLMAILCAKAMGAGRIIAVGSGERLALAARLGALPID